MSYLVLARKYRPRTFEEIAGQETAVRTLVGALKEGRVGHAYLLTGPRGTGKTTTARIFARALNCAAGPTPMPCGNCERCQAIEGGNDVDVIEIDAASNRRIEETRELLERVAYAPMLSRFKVYIVDEVHMLTKEAFNALLKTLEEPPAHVKFLFATTELHKVLETIRSRCQIVRLALLREETIAARLQEVFEREGVTAGEGVCLELARVGRGSLRDALSAADQLLSLVGSKPTREDVLALAGAGGRVHELLMQVERADRRGVLESVAACEGSEEALLSELLGHVRACLMASVLGPDSPLLEPDPTERGRQLERAQRLGTERLRLWLEELLLARERAGSNGTQLRVVLELALLELCSNATSMPLAELEARLLALERRLAGSGSAEPPARAQPVPAPSAVAAQPRPPPPAVPPAGESKSAEARPAVPAPPATLAPAPPRRPARAEPDAFTKNVLELFSGRLEDPA
jgi:DNA polymerase-3 subunit gamma/tau